MYNASKAKQILTNIVDGIRNPPPICRLVSLTSTVNKFNNLAFDCCDLYSRIENDDDDRMINIDLFKHILSLECRYNQLRARLLILPTVILIYTTFIATYLLVHFCVNTNLIKKVLNVETPENLIFFGIFGAFTYITTLLLEKFQNESNSDLFHTIINYSLRILLSISTPIILVSLFFDKNGTIITDIITPNLIAFICGYSSKFITDVLNKIIKKCSNLIS